MQVWFAITGFKQKINLYGRFLHRKKETTTVNVADLLQCSRNNCIFLSDSKKINNQRCQICYAGGSGNE